MKLIGRLPRWMGGDEVEVNLMIPLNAFIFAMYVLSHYWLYAWKFVALWRWFWWHFG